MRTGSSRTDEPHANGYRSVSRNDGAHSEEKILLSDCLNCGFPTNASSRIAGVSASGATNQKSTPFGGSRNHVGLQWSATRTSCDHFIAGNESFTDLVARTESDVSFREEDTATPGSAEGARKTMEGLSEAEGPQSEPSVIRRIPLSVEPPCSRFPHRGSGQRVSPPTSGRRALRQPNRVLPASSVSPTIVIKRQQIRGRRSSQQNPMVLGRKKLSLGCSESCLEEEREHNPQSSSSSVLPQHSQPQSASNNGKYSELMCTPSELSVRASQSDNVDRRQLLHDTEWLRSQEREATSPPIPSPSNAAVAALHHVQRHSGAPQTGNAVGLTVQTDTSAPRDWKQGLLAHAHYLRRSDESDTSSDECVFTETTGGVSEAVYPNEKPAAVSSSTAFQAERCERETERSPAAVCASCSCSSEGHRPSRNACSGPIPTCNSGGLAVVGQSDATEPTRNLRQRLNISQKPVGHSDDDTSSNSCDDGSSMEFWCEGDATPRTELPVAAASPPPAHVEDAKEDSTCVRATGAAVLQAIQEDSSDRSPVRLPSGGHAAKQSAQVAQQSLPAEMGRASPIRNGAKPSTSAAASSPQGRPRGQPVPGGQPLGQEAAQGKSPLRRNSKALHTDEGAARSRLSKAAAGATPVGQVAPPTGMPLVHELAGRNRAVTPTVKQRQVRPLTGIERPGQMRSLLVVQTSTTHAEGTSNPIPLLGGQSPGVPERLERSKTLPPTRRAVTHFYTPNALPGEVETGAGRCSALGAAKQPVTEDVEFIADRTHPPRRSPSTQRLSCALVRDPSVPLPGSTPSTASAPPETPAPPRTVEYVPGVGTSPHPRRSSDPMEYPPAANGSPERLPLTPWSTIYHATTPRGRAVETERYGTLSVTALAPAAASGRHTSERSPNSSLSHSTLSVSKTLGSPESRTTAARVRKIFMADTRPPEIPLENEEDTCCICLEPYSAENPMTLAECKHHFHLQCILSWNQKRSVCPVCTKDIFDSCCDASSLPHTASTAVDPREVGARARRTTPAAQNCVREQSTAASAGGRRTPGQRAGRPPANSQPPRAETPPLPPRRVSLAAASQQSQTQMGGAQRVTPLPPRHRAHDGRERSSILAESLCDGHQDTRREFISSPSSRPSVAAYPQRSRDAPRPLQSASTSSTSQGTAHRRPSAVPGQPHSQRCEAIPSSAPAAKPLSREARSGYTQGGTAQGRPHSAAPQNCQSQRGRGSSNLEKPKSFFGAISNLFGGGKNGKRRE